MPTKTKIKEEMEFNKTMEKLIEALKGIAASQFQALKKKKKDRFEKFDGYFTNFFRLMDLIHIDHPALNPVTDRLGVIAVTSDQGFMGVLNAKITSKVSEVAGGAEAELLVTGKRGAAKLKALGKDIKVFPAIIEAKRYTQAVRIKEYAMQQCLERKIGKLWLVYANPISFTSQKVEAVQLLPATALFEGKKKYKLYEKQALCVESHYESIVEYLIGTWITTKLYETFFDSKLSEFAAQSVQLEGSLQYLTDEGKKLKLKYNKARQEAVDSAMREVFSAILGSASMK